MKGFIGNIEKMAKENTNFRKVLYTSRFSQLVLMSISPGEEIGMEVHNENDQFLRVEEGEGKVIIDGVETTISDGYAIIIPSGCKHNVLNTSKTAPLKLYTIYSPPHHKDGVVHKSKQDATNDDEEFNGVTSE